MKLCCSCNELLEDALYSKYSESPDGLQPKCKKCTNLYSRKWREQRPSYYKNIRSLQYKRWREWYYKQKEKECLVA